MELWERWRHEFPVTEKLVYLNHAAVAPLSRRAAVAMQNLAQDALEFGSFHYPEWMATYEAIRTLTARLINAEAEEIAIIKNTSEGIATVATGIRWKPGDVVVAFEEEFPANYFPWKRLEAAGVEVRWLSVFSDPARINEAIQGAKLLAISFVQYLSGYRISLEKIGSLCSKAGCLFFVDAIQGMGAFPIDVRAAKIDALSADGHKWLLGPEGCGVLYVRREVQEQIEPVQIGWTNFSNYAGYSSRQMILRPNAGRYESGTLNTIGCCGLRASLELILEVGVANVAPAVQALSDQLATGAQAIGFGLLGNRSPETGAGIVAIRKDDVDAQLIVKRLKDAGIIAAARQGWVRFAPHFYISPEDIQRTLGELEAVMAAGRER